MDKKYRPRRTVTPASIPFKNRKKEARRKACRKPKPAKNHADD